MAKSVANDNIFINKKTILAMENKGNSHIQHVKIGKDVKEIGAEAFSMCPNLNSIEVDADNERFTSANGANAIIDKENGVLLVGCQATVIPECVKEIGPFAFCGQTSIKQVRIPSNVKKISAYAFDGCSNVAEIILEEGVECLGEYCFRNTTNLETIHFPSSMIWIETNAFGAETDAGQDDDGYWVDFTGGPEKITTIYYGGTKAQYNHFQSWLNGSLNLSDKENVVIICSDGVYGDGQTEPNDEYWINGIF